LLTKLIAKNFKRFEKLEIELANPVVFIGPNNSGKTSALQALALWDVGIKRWSEKRSVTAEKRPGVTINRRDMVSAPVPDASLLWRDLHVRDVRRVDGKQDTKNIRMDITIEGIEGKTPWICGLEFDYANAESFYCRPLRLSEDKIPKRMSIPKEALQIQIAFLPPMSGLAANETKLEIGAINVKVGEGRTAEVLRNLCYKISNENIDLWQKLTDQIRSLFGSALNPPTFIPERGEIEMTYQEKGNKLDLSSSGRGLQQTLLLLSYMYANKGSILLLDEPDAHLEILRQRQIYQLLVDVASENGNQIIAASHSEVLLNEAANRDTVIAFVGTPHRIDNRGSQVLKALKDIGFDHYYLAEQTGWILYLEGSTDLAILRSFAKRLGHEKALRALERPFVYYVGDQATDVSKHFFGLKEAVPNLIGIAIFDRLEKGLPENLGPAGYCWTKREIENYLCFPETLKSFANEKTTMGSIGPLFDKSLINESDRAMGDSINEVESALETLSKGSPWHADTKVSDDFLTPVFEKFYKRMKMPNLMAKTNFHQLVDFVPIDKIDEEIMEKLNLVVDIAEKAKPRK